MVLKGKQLFLLVVIISIIITGCSSQRSSSNEGVQNDKQEIPSIPKVEGNQKVDVLETYKNNNYNFSFKIPVSWKGKYKVIQKDNRISFIYSGWPDLAPEIFAIMVMTEEELMKANAEPPSIPEQYILGRRNNLVYFYITAITVPLPTIINSSPKEEDYKKHQDEWGKLFRTLNDIPKRFHFE